MIKTDKNWTPEMDVPTPNECIFLREMGYPQDGMGWYWVSTIPGSGLTFSYTGISEQYKQTNLPIPEYYRAPTVGELLEQLPKEIEIDREIRYLVVFKTKDGWGCCYAPPSKTIGELMKTQSIYPLSSVLAGTWQMIKVIGCAKKEENEDV